MPCQRPMILQETAIAGYRKTGIDRAEGLPERIGPVRCEIFQTGEDVCAPEAIRHGSIQMDAVNRRASFQEVTPERAGGCGGQLAMRLTALAVPIVWAPEVHHPGDVDTGADSVIGTQHRAPVR